MKKEIDLKSVDLLKRKAMPERQYQMQNIVKDFSKRTPQERMHSISQAEIYCALTHIHEQESASATMLQRRM